MRKGKGGALLQHYTDYAGDGDRDDVNMTNIQTFYYWSLNETTSIGSPPLDDGDMTRGPGTGPGTL